MIFFLISQYFQNLTFKKKIVIEAKNGVKITWREQCCYMTLKEKKATLARKPEILGPPFKQDKWDF